MSTPVTAESDARDLHVALMAAHEEHTLAERQEMAVFAAPLRTEERMRDAILIRERTAARARELDAWLQAKLVADADRRARLEAELKRERRGNPSLDEALNSGDGSYRP